MIVVDVGNTDSVCGLFRGDELTHHWRVPTQPDISATGLRAALPSLFAENDGSPVIVASVVPSINATLQETFKGQLIHFISYQSPFSFKIAVAHPEKVGADRLVNSEAALKLYGCPAIIVDTGTATTFCALSADQRYLGGAIAPGMATAAQGLFTRAALLKPVDLQPLQRYIGANTEEGVQSGVVNGHAAMIDGMVERIRTEMGEAKAKIIGTGGLINLLRPHLHNVEFFDPFLTLKGLNMVGRRLHG